MKQFSPMLMNTFMRRLLTIIGILIAAVSTYAAPVKYIGCSPESGSEINSFDFTLNFDITEAIDELGVGEWGLGYNGLLSQNRCARLYKGTEETGTELAITLTPNFTGKSEGFTVNGSSISMSFPLNTAPEEGQLYTIVISNIFTIYESGKAVPKSAVSLSYETTPLILTFIGASAQSTELVLQSISIDEGTNLETLNEIEFSFNEDIAVNNNAKVSISDGETVVYNSELCEIASDRKNVLKATFAENTNLYNSHKYTVILPEGAVSLASNTNKTNKSISLTVNGTLMRYFGIKSIYPENNIVCLPSKANVVFELPQGASLFKTNAIALTTLKIYENTKSPETMIKQTGGTFIENATGIEWSLDGFQFKPSTDYILCMEKGTSTLFDADGGYMREWSNEEVLINFTTPSIENSGIPQLEFGQAIIGQHNKGQAFTDNMELASIQELNIGLKDNLYTYNNIQTNKLTLVPDVFAAGMNKGQLYEITADGDMLVKEFPIMVGEVIETYDSYSVLGAILSATLYEGKQYRIVIPAGVVTIPMPSLYNYVLNPELSYTVIGTTPTEAKILSCTVEDNAEMSELYNVVWAFNGDFSIEPDTKPTVKIGNITYLTYPLELKVNAGVSYLLLNLTSKTTGRPVTLSDGKNVIITIPAGILRHPTDESITNEEIVLNIKGKTPAPAVPEPEFVTVTVLVKEDVIASKDDIETVPTVYSYTLDAVKENKFKLDFKDGDWKLGSLYRDGIDVLGMTDDDGVYTTPSLKENTVIVASLEYRNGDYVTIDQATGIGQIPGTKYIVRIDAGHIVISGLEGNETINVYNMAGIAVANTAVTAGMDIVRIGAQPGQYIVLVNETPFKAIVR